MAGPWEKYASPQSGQVFDLPPDPQTVRDNTREDRRDGEGRKDRVFDNTKKLRDEFYGSTSVKDFNVALGTFNSAMKTKPTAEGDQALIVSFARMLDPNSVVREGEFVVAAGNESTFDQIKARLAKEFGVDGAGRLTEQGRTRLREEMRNLVVERFQAPYERDRKQFAQFARMEGIDPYMVIGEPAQSAFPATLLDPPKVEENFAVSTDGQKAQELPQEYQDAHYAYLRQNWGKLDPQAYATFRSGLDERYGQTPDTAAYEGFVPNANAVAAEGGSPADLGAVPSPNVDMGWLESQFAKGYTPGGAVLANFGNAMAAGVPARLSGNQDRLEDIRAINPGYSMLGEFGGGMAGTALGGWGARALSRGLQEGSRGAALLNNATGQNVAFGATYGATQDDNPYRGAALGGLSAYGGDLAGNAIGKALPGVFNRGGIRAADETVPTVDQLQEAASQLYRQTEANGVTASPQATNEMIERAAAVLLEEGRMSPTGRVVGGGDVAEAMQMLGDYEGLPMTPTQVGAVRKTLGEGRTAMKDGVPDYNSRRIAGNMLDEFDQWAEPALPGVEDARAVAQRAILGREMARNNEIAVGPKASQFTQSGEENAFRNIYRGLDTAEIKGRNSYPPELVDKIQEVSRGTPFSNAMRALGKLAPTGAIPVGTSAGLGTLGAAVGGGPVGLAIMGGAMTGGLFGRKLATSATTRAAKEAELIARGGPEYADLLEEARKMAGIYGGSIFSGPAAVAGSRNTR